MQGWLQDKDKVKPFDACSQTHTNKVRKRSPKLKIPMEDSSSEEPSSASVESRPSWCSLLMKQRSNTRAIPYSLAIARNPLPGIPQALHVLYSYLAAMYLILTPHNLSSSTSCYSSNTAAGQRLANTSPPTPLYLSPIEHTKANLSLSLSKKLFRKELYTSGGSRFKIPTWEIKCLFLFFFSKPRAFLNSLSFFGVHHGASFFFSFHLQCKHNPGNIMG